MTTEPTKSATDIPPLRIHHILIATAVTAILLSMAKLMSGTESFAMSAFFTSGQGVMSLLTCGIELTLLGFGIYWRRTGRQFFNEPGHWLLLFVVFRLVLYIALFWSWLVHSSEAPSFPVFALGIYSLILYIGWPVLNFVAARRGFDSRWWRRFFLLNGILYIGTLVAHRFITRELIMLPTFLFCSILLAILIAAATADIRAGRQRDWVHWLGVFFTGLNLIVGVFMGILRWVIG